MPRTPPPRIVTETGTDETGMTYYRVHPARMAPQVLLASGVLLTCHGTDGRSYQGHRWQIPGYGQQQYVDETVCIRCGASRVMAAPAKTKAWKLTPREQRDSVPRR